MSELGKLPVLTWILIRESELADRGPAFPAMTLSAADVRELAKLDRELRAAEAVRNELGRWTEAFLRIAQEGDPCPGCGEPLELVACPKCHGEGGWHNCGEDSCCCADPDEITDVCEECDGTGDVLACVSDMHRAIAAAAAVIEEARRG